MFSEGKSYERLRIERLSLLIEAADLQRRALRISRGVLLNEVGAFEMNDAAAMLRDAAVRLERVSFSILKENPIYERLRPSRLRAV